MSEKELQRIADEADFIVNGYAFTKLENNMIDILNLEHPDCAMVISKEGELISTNMEAIEQKVVFDLYKRNMQFFEE